MFLFYFFAAVSLWLGWLSLSNGIRFARYVREQLAPKVPDYTPRATVIAPCRGIDQGFAENLTGLLQQDYPNYDVLFVTDSAADNAIQQIERARLQTTASGVQLLIAGPAVKRGQKVHNLIYATERLSTQTDVLVFVDSDARPWPGWLRSLVGPLSNPALGAATGYRWFIPVNGGVVSLLLSVWNASIASALGENTARNFCWGGSTAIRRTVFEQLNVRQSWAGSASDDFTLTHALQSAKLPVHFVPSCLVPSFEDCTLRELLTFSNRQLQITRVYAPHLWKPLFIGSVIFNLTFFGGIILVGLLAAAGQFHYVALAALAAIFLLGASKAFIRFRAVHRVMRDQNIKLRGVVAHVVLWPFASLLQLINCIVAATSRRISWRGITYELKSPSETVIIARD